MNATEQLQEITHTYTAQVAALSAQIALDHLASAFNGAVVTKTGVRAPASNGGSRRTKNVVRERKMPQRAKASAEPAKKASAPASAASAASAGKGQKRTPQELDAIRADVLGCIKKTPGIGMESIRKSLGRETSDLTLPIRQLCAEKLLRGEGEKRARKYWPR